MATFGQPQLMYPNMHGNSYRPPLNHHWRHPHGPRPPFLNQYQHRPPFQPGNDNYWCETCDRGFATQDILNKHTNQHEKCNIDGCQFVAHPKVITKHIQMQHSSGLYKKIANLNKPEDIEKWREERRKKYPTKINIDKKAAELKAKIDRGEKMGLARGKPHFQKHGAPYDRKNRKGQDLKRRQNTRHGNEPRSKFKRNYTDNNTQNKPPTKTTPKILPAVEENRKLKPFAGILQLVIESESDTEETNNTIEALDLIEDDDFDVLKSNEIKPVDINEPIVCSAITSLICDYGSTDEEDDEVTVSTPLKVTKQETFHNTVKPNKNENIHNQEPIVKEYMQQLQIAQSENISQNVQIEISRESSQNICNENKHVIKSSPQHNGKQITKQDISERQIVKENLNINNNAEHEDNARIVNINPDINKNVEDENDSGPEEVKVEKHENAIKSISTENVLTKSRAGRKKVVPEKKVFRRQKPKLPSTLLQKLLSREIQQERNIILQCIRYIRSNNYFNKTN